MTGYRESTHSDGESLDKFRFEPGDKFVRHPHYHDPVDNPDPTKWAVVKRRHVYTVSYLPDRDGTPGPEDHREYELGSEDLERTTVTEAELLTEWEPLDSTE